MRTASSERARTIGLAALAVCVLVLEAAGCARKSAPGPMPADRAERALSAWPQGHTQPLKITDALTLEIPLQYERSAISHDQSATRALISQQSDRSEARFDFFLPDFTGYTLENFRNQSDENRVEVVYLHAGDAHEADPDAPGEYPPNMLKRSLEDLLNPNDYQDMYAPRCYQGRAASARLKAGGAVQRSTYATRRGSTTSWGRMRSTVVIIRSPAVKRSPSR